MPLPILPMVFPTTLKGLENGKLPTSVLKVFLLDDNDAVTCEVTAARAFQALFAAARKALPGLRVREVGGYRSYAGQLSLFLSRYKAVSKSVYDNTPFAHRKFWKNAPSLGYSSAYWVKKSNNLATAAVPGTSNHGWGLAIDIAENTDTDSAPEGITSRFVHWLSANAPHYGISAELQSEVWHWRYVAGDNIPKLVLQYENSLNPPPQPPPVPPSEDDMEYLDKPQRIYDSRVHAAPNQNYPGSGAAPLAPRTARLISIPYAKQNPNGTGGILAAEINLTIITDGTTKGFAAVSAGDVLVVEHSDINWNYGEPIRNMQLRTRVDSKTGMIRVHCGPEPITHLIIDWKAFQPVK